MPRRPRIRIDPTRAASRTLAVNSAGGLDKLETDFLADKSVKDTKLADLEADKAVKDTKIANLESDKNDKDTRVAALESDKNAKDTKMSDIESDMTSLTSRVSTLESSEVDTSDLATKVSLGNVRVSLGNLATRVSSLETLGISGISNAVSWTNLTEINLSGEKLTNGDFSSTSWAFDTSFTFPTTPESGNYTFSETVYIQWLDDGTANFTENKVYEILRYALHNGDLELENDLGSVVWVGARKQRYNANDKIRGEEWEVVDKVPSNWSVHSGTLDETKLASGIVDGTGGAVAIQQMFSSGIASGTTLVCKATRNDSNTGSVYINALRANGTPWSSNFHIQPSDGYVEFTTTEIMYGLRLTTNHGTREVSDISLFQGAASGGTVQAYAGGGLEKISGTSGYNSGGFSVNYIPGNSDGYFQFQLAQNNKALRVGLVYADADYSTVSPFGLDFNATGNIDNMNPYQDNITTYAQGDWFRVRHYAASNQVHFQKRGTVYVDDTDFCLLQTCGLQPNNGHQYNHTFATVDRPLIIAKETVNGLTTGEYYRIHAVNTSSGNTRIYTLAGVQIGWMTGRGTNWEVQKESGQDYFTFLTSSTTTNGSDLYLDVAFDSVGGRINDVTIVT